MTRIIELDGQIARLVEREIVGEVPLTDIRPLLATRAPTIFPVMPDHTRVAAFNPERKQGIVIIEINPTRHHLNVHYDRGETGCTHRDYERHTADGRAQFYVQLPYQYFVYSFTLETRGDNNYDGQMADFTLDDGFLYWRKERLSGIEDELIPARIWNVNRARICWGYQRHDISSMAERIDDMVKNFPFTDFTAHYGSPVPRPYEDYTEWEEASEDPACYTNWTEFDTPADGHTTVQRLIDRIIGDPEETLLADTTRTFDAIAEPPPIFTIGRMIEWFEALPEALKPRFLWALNRELTGAEPPADLNLPDYQQERPEEPTVDEAPEPVAAAADGEEVEVPGVGRVTVRRRRRAVTHLADGTPMPAGTAQTVIDPTFEPIDPAFEPGEDQD